MDVAVPKPYPSEFRDGVELGRDLTDHFELRLAVGRILAQQPQRALPELRRILRCNSSTIQEKRNHQP